MNLTIKAGGKLCEQSPFDATGGLRRNIGYNSLRSIVTSGGSVFRRDSVGKVMFSCLQNILYEEVIT